MLWSFILYLVVDNFSNYNQGAGLLSRGFVGDAWVVVFFIHQAALVLGLALWNRSLRISERWLILFFYAFLFEMNYFFGIQNPCADNEMFVGYKCLPLRLFYSWLGFIASYSIHGCLMSMIGLIDLRINKSLRDERCRPMWWKILSLGLVTFLLVFGWYMTFQRY